jgi:prophage tail gpP-like protein
MTTRDHVAIEADGLFIDAWTGASFSSDMFTPADAFRVNIGVGKSTSRALRKGLDELREKIRAGAVVKFHVSHNGKTALQGTGIADAREIMNAAGEGTTFDVEGRDLASLLVDSASNLDVYKDGSTLLALARASIEPWTGAPWSLKVKTDANGARNIRTGKTGRKSTRNNREQAEALGIPASKLSSKIALGIDNGTIDPTQLITSTSTGRSKGNGISPAQIAQLKIQQANAQAGETVWDFLDRHARRLGVMMRMGPDGTLVMTGIDYGQRPLYSLIRRIDDGRSNNIISGGERLDTARVFSQVRVLGKAKGRGTQRSAIDVTVDDFNEDALPHEKVLLVRDDTVRTQSQAETRAYRELAKTKQGAQVFTYVVHGFGQDGNVYAPDTVCSVWDEVTGTKRDLYITSRTFEMGLQTGPRTTLRMVPLGAIQLDAEAA